MVERLHAIGGWSKSAREKEEHGSVAFSSDRLDHSNDH